MAHEINGHAVAIMEMIHDIRKIGDFAVPFKKDCIYLARRIALLSHLVEEIRDFNPASSPPSSSSFSSPSLCLNDLQMALEAAKRLLQIGGCSTAIDSTAKRITFQFQFVTWQLEKVLENMPYDHFDISDEVREQVELVCTQLRRVTVKNGSLNSKFFTIILCVLSPTNDNGVNKQELSRAIGNLQIEKIGNIDPDFQSMVDMVSEVYGKGRTCDLQLMKFVLERLRNPALADAGTINEDNNAKIDGLANKSLEEIKKPDSPRIPDDFRCPISLELMRDPVIVATGQTYERSFIQRWIDCGNRMCPKTQQKLPNLRLTPNYVLRSVISHWCEANKIELPQGLANSRIRKSDGSLHEVSGDRSAIDALVHKLSSQSLDELRTAACEIRLLAKRSTDNRILIAEAGAIPLLVNLLQTEDLTLQENAVTAILNLSIYDSNKASIMLAGAVPPIVEILGKGSMEARENAAATLFSLSLIDENKITIGASGAIKALVELLCNGSMRGKKDAATALFNLCIYQGNKPRAARAGIIVPLMRMLTETGDGMVDEALTILSVLASHKECKAAIVKVNAIPVFIDLIRTGQPRNKENAAAILLSLCKKDHDNLACIARLGALIPLTELAKGGTDRAKRKATSLLEHLSRMKQKT